MMHHFCKWGERDEDSLPADMLDKCLRYLLDNQFSVIPLSKYVETLMSRSSLYKSVVLTVDDGHRDFYEYAYPLFAKYKMPVAVFLVSDYIDGKLTLWWDQVRYAIDALDTQEVALDASHKHLRFPLRNARERSLATDHIIQFCKTISEEQRGELIKELNKLRTGDLSPRSHRKNRPLSWDDIIEMAEHGIEFFPHTKTHPMLIQCTQEKARHEICESKKRVETKLAKGADIFCYPNGRFSDFDDTLVCLLKSAGYKAALTAEEGFDCTHEKNDLFRLRRQPFPGTFLRFKQLVSGLEAFKNNFRS